MDLAAPPAPSKVIFLPEIVKEGIEENVRQEIDEVINGKTSRVTIRRKRFEEDIKKLEATVPITDSVKEAYVQRVLNEIYLTPEQSKDLYKRNISARHPNASQEELDSYENSETYLRLETYDECLAKFKTSVYVSRTTNDILLKSLLSEGLLTEEEYAKRYVYGGDPNKASVSAVQKIQKNENER